MACVLGAEEIAFEPVICIEKRLRLFNSTVTGCALWARESWTPRVEGLRKLIVAQNRMLRKIAGCSRAADEPRVDWVLWATQRARHLIENNGLKGWAPEHIRRTWLWAGR
eukprot:7054739-Pyramimonas_sp.AAC.1